MSIEIRNLNSFKRKVTLPDGEDRRKKTFVQKQSVKRRMV